jgi:hypothetical protein
LVNHEKQRSEDSPGKDQSLPFNSTSLWWQEVIIARGSKPVARLVAIGEAKGKRQPGALKGKVLVGQEFFEPLPAGELSTGE